MNTSVDNDFLLSYRPDPIYWSARELADSFPNARRSAKDAIKKRRAEIIELQDEKVKLNDDQYLLSLMRIVYTNLSFIDIRKYRDREEAVRIIDRVFFAQPIESKLEHIKKMKQYLNATEPQVQGSSAITKDDIDRANATPIDSLITVARNGYAKCCWHNEKTPSMKVYKDNHVHCFGCGKSGDAIDVYRSQNPHISFHEAVRAMLHII